VGQPEPIFRTGTSPGRVNPRVSGSPSLSPSLTPSLSPSLSPSRTPPALLERATAPCCMALLLYSRIPPHGWLSAPPSFQVAQRLGASQRDAVYAHARRTFAFPETCAISLAPYPCSIPLVSLPLSLSLIAPHVYRTCISPLDSTASSPRTTSVGQGMWWLQWSLTLPRPMNDINDLTEGGRRAMVCGVCRKAGEGPALPPCRDEAPLTTHIPTQWPYPVESWRLLFCPPVFHPCRKSVSCDPVFTIHGPRPIPRGSPPPNPMAHNCGAGRTL
jgi:hypothetical protein